MISNSDVIHVYVQKSLIVYSVLPALCVFTISVYIVTISAKLPATSIIRLL